MGFLNEGLIVSPFTSGFNILTDTANRKPSYSMYGETITSSRKLELSAKFEYGVSTYDFNITQVNGATVSDSNSQAVLSTSASINGKAQISTRKTSRYIPGNEFIFFGTSEFSNGKNNSLQQVGVFDSGDGFWIGLYGGNFCISRRKNGIDNIVVQDNFNLDKLDGSGLSRFNLNYIKNNIYKISFSYLGAGNATFEIFDSSKLTWIPFHTIKWANNENGTHITQPSLPITICVENTGNNSDIVIKTGSLHLSIVSENDIDSPSYRTFGYQVTKTINANTLTNILSLKVKDTFKGKTNRVSVRPIYLSIASDGTKNVQIVSYGNPTITGSNFVNVDTENSVSQIDISGTTVTGGTTSLGLSLGKVDSQFLFVKSLNRLIYPNNIFSLTAYSTATTDITIFYVWEELF